MKGIKGIIIKVTAGIVLFSAGIAVGVPACRMYDRAAASAETTVSASAGTAGAEEMNGGGAEEMNDDGAEDELTLRVRDGNLEWYDGVRWNHAGTLEELAAADPIAQPSEEWQVLVSRLAETRAGEQAGEPPH